MDIYKLYTVGGLCLFDGLLAVTSPPVRNVCVCLLSYSTAWVNCLVSQIIVTKYIVI